MRELRYTVFGTIGQSFRVWFRNFIPFTILGILFFSPLIVYTVSLMRDASHSSLTKENLTLWLIVICTLIYAFDQFLAAPIVYGVVQELNGTHAGLGACIVQGLKRFLPVFFTVLLLYWCVFFGSYPLVVPGIVLACGLYVAVPCSVCERPTVLGTLSRSFFLTEGNRMRVLGLLLLFWGARIGAQVAVVRALDPHGRPTELQLALGAMLAINFLFSCLGAVMQGVSYSRMRELRDGVSTADLASVFE